MMQESIYKKRVKRLVTSGLCSSRNEIEHMRELKESVSSMDSKSLKQDSKIFKALSDQTRLKIIRLLSGRDMCVCEIMVALDMTQPTASHHLNILENVGLVDYRREGKWIFYGLTNPDILAYLDRIQSFA